MNTSDMAHYLIEIEQEDGFIPWDDEEHAAKHLVTVFRCTPDQARTAVSAANVSTKSK